MIAMCGIAAIYAFASGAPPVDPRELDRINQSMEARGPDGEGQWLAEGGRVGLAHKRLAIIDPSTSGAQPMMLNGAGGVVRLAITYNGEIYNFRALREQLIAEGRELHTQSDTEVLLHLYDRDGPEMVNSLRGMFAFALWDETRQGLFMARDPFGIKPLYLANDGKCLRIASQVKALIAGGGIATSPDSAGHVGFHILGYVPEPHTLYAEIEALPSGTSLWVGADGQRRETQFYDPRVPLRYDHPVGDENERRERLRAALADTVTHHLVADVPVGVFLSAGLDSATVTGLASESAAASLDTMTLSFDELSGTSMDEGPLAEEIAALYGTRHQTRKVAGAEFHDDMEKLFAAMDQPSIDGANTYFVAKEAAAMGLKVALSGLGGDEIFGGYLSFRQIPQMVRSLGWVPGIKQIGRAFQIVSAPLIKQFTSPKYAGVLEYSADYGSAYLLRRGLFMPWELPEILDPDMAREGWRKLELLTRLEQTTEGIRSAHGMVSALELMWYMRNQLLRDSDWAGMAHSLEIRTPLVDGAFFQAIAELGASKQDMARAPATPLPRSVLNRPKTGFYLPVREWIMGDNAEGALGRGYRGWARMVYSKAVGQV